MKTLNQIQFKCFYKIMLLKQKKKKSKFRFINIRKVWIKHIILSNLKNDVCEIKINMIIKKKAFIFYCQMA